MDEKNIQTNNNLKTVRTYMTDMADSVRENEISVMKVALAEQQKREMEEVYRQVEGTPLKKFFWILGSIIFVSVALYGGYFLLQKRAEKNSPEMIKAEQSIISHDEVVSIGTNSDIDFISELKKIFKEKTSLEKNDSIKYIILENNINNTKSKITKDEIFYKLELTAPSSLIRSLGDDYMIGSFSKGKEDLPESFLLFQTIDYSLSYAGMLEWEKTLGENLLYLFDLKTTDSKIQISERKFKDIILNNKDVRILLNEENKPILMYIFLDKKNLLITTSTDVIKEIEYRLRLKNIKN